MSKTALITGITGQDGSYLAEYLLSKGYEVHGIIRRASTFNTARIDHIYTDPHEEDVKLYLHYGDLSEAETINNIIYNIRPDEVYNLGAQSHVRVSFDVPEYTTNVVATGVTRLLESMRRAGNDVRFYQASSSEMFGSTAPPQSETTPFAPRSPYACSKLYAYWLTRNYREGYGIFASNGILFNHESPRRGETFVTRKITRAIAAIVAGKQDALYLGNLKARRDWGYAPEYVEAMHTHAAAGEGRRLRYRDRGDALGARSSWRRPSTYAGLDQREVRQDRPQVLPAHRGRGAGGRRFEGQEELKFEPEDDVQGTGPHHGGRGHARRRPGADRRGGQRF